MSKRVLVVDDDVEIRFLCQAVLSDAGFEILEAVDGEDGLRVLGEGPRPDVILLDLMMPRMDGFEMLRVLKADVRYRNIPVVVMSAAPDDHIERSREWAQAAIAKPFDTRGLVGAIRSVLGCEELRQTDQPAPRDS